MFSANRGHVRPMQTFIVFYSFLKKRKTNIFSSTLYFGYIVSNTNLSSLLYLQAGMVNPATFSKAFNEWRYFNFEIQRYKGLDGFVCPCCQDQQHSVHVDGNKKLYRYAKVPRYRNCTFSVLLSTIH